MFCHAVRHFLAVYMFNVCLLHCQFKTTFEMLTKKLLWIGIHGLEEAEDW